MLLLEWSLRRTSRSSSTCTTERNVCGPAERKHDEERQKRKQKE